VQRVHLELPPPDLRRQSLPTSRRHPLNAAATARRSMAAAFPRPTVTIVPNAPIHVRINPFLTARFAAGCPDWVGRPVF